MRGLGRLLWQKRPHPRRDADLRRRRLRRRQCRSPRDSAPKSRLLLESRENVFLRAEADKNSDRSAIDAEAVTSQIQVVLSRDLAREVIAKEKLADNPEFDPRSAVACCARFSACSGSARDPELDDHAKSARWKPITSGSTSMRSKSRASSPSISPRPIRELAASVANTIAETYLRMQQAAKQDQTRAAGDVARRRDRQDAREGRRRRGQGRGISRASPICLPAPTIRRCRASSLPRSIRRFGGARPAGRPAGAREAVARADPARASRSTPPTSPIREIDAPPDRAAHASCARSWPSSRRRCSTSIRASRN